MLNGSLDKFLYGNERTNLNWLQRFRIIKGVASGILYLHEEWEQVLVHRDVKSSNVLLDAELNGKLGDFGLARLCDHGAILQTTHVVGTTTNLSFFNIFLSTVTKNVNKNLKLLQLYTTVD